MHDLQRWRLGAIPLCPLVSFVDFRDQINSSIYALFLRVPMFASMAGPEAERPCPGDSCSSLSFGYTYRLCSFESRALRSELLALYMEKCRLAI